MSVDRYLVRAAILAAVALFGAGCEHSANGRDVDFPQVAGSVIVDSAVGMNSTTVPTPGGRFVVQGAILQKYLAYGGLAGSLGMPTSNEQPAQNLGRYTTFAGGAIYWTPRTGAHVVWGRIRERWDRSGGPAGPLGYPITDERNLPGGWESMFQHGIIVHTAGQTRVETR